LKILKVSLALLLSLILTTSICFPILAYGGEAEVNLKVEIIPPPENGGDGGGGGGTPIYPVKTNLFGVEKTYYTEYDGDLRDEISGTSEDGNLTITILEGTTALDKDGKRLDLLEVVVNENPPEPPEDTNIIGLPYSFTPAKATFNPSIALTWTYEPSDLPEGVLESNLILAFYSEDLGEWIELVCVVDIENNTITASIPHFTTFAILGTIPQVLLLPEPEQPEIPIELEEPIVEVPIVETPEVVEPEVEIEEPGEPEPVIEPGPVVEPEPGFSWWWILGIVIGLGIVIWGIAYWVKKKRQRQI